MRRFCAIRIIGLVCGGVLILAALAVRAEGPLTVGGPGFIDGKPFRWDPASFPLTYWTDPGPATGFALGNQTAQQADALVAQAFQTWQDVATASITFNAAGKLGVDITSANYMTFDNNLEDCTTAPGPPAGGIAQNRSVVYDVDGSIITALGWDPNSLLGFADPVCFESNGSENLYTRGLALLNGMWIDGVNTASNGEVTLAEFRAVFIHEFGHLIGLDHSQINVNCYVGSCSPGSADAQGLPTMFPYLLQGLELEMASLAEDDVAALSELYPTADFSTTTGRIQGRIFFSDHVTQVQGLNVIARLVSDPRRTAASSVSGFLFTADEGNPVYPWQGSPFGSHDETLIGYYEIPGLSPGDYTIEVEAINPDFTEGSGVGPITSYGIVFPIPGNCATEFANTSPPESDSDSCTDQTPVTVNTGAVTDIGTDIILNGTPPRFDAWEDGP